MNKLKVKAVFFDFDDTLQSRKGAYKIYCEGFLDKYFPNISKKEREEKLFQMEEHVDGGYKEREVYFPELIELWLFCICGRILLNGIEARCQHIKGSTVPILNLDVILRNLIDLYLFNSLIDPQPMIFMNHIISDA